MSQSSKIVPLVVVEVDGVNVKLPIVGEVGDVQRLSTSATGDAAPVLDNVIVWNPGVPTDPEMFAEYLEQCFRVNNPDLVRFRLAGGVK